MQSFAVIRITLEMAMQQSQSGYITHGTVDIVKAVQLDTVKFYSNSYVCIKL